MNKVYLNIITINATKFLRCNALIVVVMLYIMFTVIILSSYSSPRGSLFTGALMASFWMLIFSAVFWQNGWAVGNVDPLTGMHTEKLKNDRLFMPFMCCLPLSRNTHYRLQVLAYILFSIAICGLSFGLHLLHPVVGSYLRIVVLIHLSFFTGMLFFGGFMVMAIPNYFLGPITSVRHPMFYRPILVAVLCVVTLAYSRDISAFLGQELAARAVNLLAENPFIFLVINATSGLMFWRGGYKFDRVDIN